MRIASSSRRRTRDHGAGVQRGAVLPPPCHRGGAAVEPPQRPVQAPLPCARLQQQHDAARQSFVGLSLSALVRLVACTQVHKVVRCC